MNRHIVSGSLSLTYLRINLLWQCVFLSSDFNRNLRLKTDVHHFTLHFYCLRLLYVKILNYPTLFPQKKMDKIIEVRMLKEQG